MFTKMEKRNYMNKIEKDIILFLKKHPFYNQRALAEEIGSSLGKTNQALHTLQDQGYLDMEMCLTANAIQLLEIHRPKNAIILAAGYGMRMIPINMETPKGLLQVNGEPLIERIIRQLHKAGIQNITVIVGFLKESYEYLIDEFGVELLINMEYSGKNNLHSLCLAEDRIENTYIIPCDIWCGENPFHYNELYSWYLVGEENNEESDVRVNLKQELVKTDGMGNRMIGISYITGNEAELLKKRMVEMDKDSRFQNCFWEEALFSRDKMIVSARMADSSSVHEINTYEELRELDHSSRQLSSRPIQLIAKALQVSEEEIENITILKKGMTNRSFLFTCGQKQYIMRIPGEGTEQLINRRQEYEVYQSMRGLNVSDEICYINPENGYKITAYMKNARVCDAKNREDVRKCMQRLRSFHELELQIGHNFELYEQIELYESLWGGNPSCYRDYQETKRKIYELKTYIDSQPKAHVLAHIDAVPDNFLFVKNQPGEQEIRLIDWEYAGMQDPHVDIAMFAIYAMYDREEVEVLIDAYFTEGCDFPTRLKIYCYIAVCGLLWSNWCEYKRLVGVEFGEYALKQYRYAKEYYQLVQEKLLEKENA